MVIVRKLGILAVTVLITLLMQIPKDSLSKTIPCESQCRNEYGDCVADCQKLRAGWSAIDSCVNQCTKVWVKCNQGCGGHGAEGSRQ